MLKFSNICAVIEGNCAVDGSYLLSKHFSDNVFSLSPKQDGIHVDSLTAANGIESFIFGRNRQTKFIDPPAVDYEEDTNEEETDAEPPQKIEVFSYAPLFRLRYALNVTTESSMSIARRWERKAFQFLTKKYSSDIIELSVSTSSAISDTVTEKAREEGSLFIWLFIPFLCLITIFIGCQGNQKTSFGLLTVPIIATNVLTAGSTFGLLNALNISIIEPMALIIVPMTSKVQIIDFIFCSNSILTILRIFEIRSSNALELNLYAFHEKKR